MLLDEDGTLALVTVSAEGLKVLGKHSLLSNNAWTAPTLDGRRLYVRDRRKIMAVSLGD
ncbi:MAG: hypothetical protein HY235_12415 [Acidobacteria bacterium]|nr:hypothetical protein [Acidobacteriota bacterium]